MPKKIESTSDPLTAGLDLGDPSAWLTADQVVALFPQLWRNRSSLNWDLRNRDGTPLAQFVKVLGRRTLVHRDGAARWKLGTAQARDPRWAAR